MLAFTRITFTPEECKKILDHSRQLTFIPSPVTDPDTLEEGIFHNYRKSTLAFLKRNEDTEWIFQRILSIFEEASYALGIKLNDPQIFMDPAINNYEIGDSFATHIDAPLEEIYNEKKYVRVMSMSISLNEGFEGGEFHLQSKKRIIEQRKGYANVFNSKQIHGVSEIIDGTRIILAAWIHDTSN